MQLSTFVAAASAALLATCTGSYAAPAQESTLVARQQGGGPPNSPPGTVWSRTWTDSSLLRPQNFDALPLGGCRWDVVFNRDPRDTKYNIAIYSVFGEGETQFQELKTGTNLQYRGARQADGRQQYYARVENACSTFFTGGTTPPKYFKVYFTAKVNPKGTQGYISPLFY